MKKREITDHELNTLFQTILEQSPIINEEQVNALLHNLPKGPSVSQTKRFFKNNLNFWIMTTIVSSLIMGFILWINTHSQTDITKKDEVRGHNILHSRLPEPDAPDKAYNKSANEKFLTNPVHQASNPEMERQFENNLSQEQNSTPVPSAPQELSRGSVVKLTLDELKGIGFTFTDTSVYFVNYSKDSIWSYYEKKLIDNSIITTYHSEYIQEQLNVKVTSFDYHPWCTTKKDYLTVPESFIYNLKSERYILPTQDSLIPITLDVQLEEKSQGGSPLKTMYIKLIGNDIFWVNLTPTLYKLLPDRAKDMANGLHNMRLSKNFFKQVNGGVDQINNDAEPVNNEVSSAISNALVLNRDDLIKLGFVFSNSDAEYRFQLPDEKYIPTFIRFHFESKGSSGIGIYHDNELGTVVDTIIKFPKRSFYPEIVSNNKGKSNVSWGIKWTTTTLFDTTTQQIGGIYNMLENRANYLIPVLIKLNPNQTADKDLYFWFTPTEELFNLLPKPIAKEIRNDLTIIQLKQDPKLSMEQKAQLTSSCKYFEECRTTLFNVSYTIFPNPTKDEITLQLQLENTEYLSVSVHAITGSRLQTLQPKTKFDVGAHSLNFSLATLKPGIYLVSVQNEKGENKTQRVIKE